MFRHAKGITNTRRLSSHILPHHRISLVFPLVLGLPLSEHFCILSTPPAKPVYFMDTMFQGARNNRPTACNSLRRKINKEPPLVSRNAQVDHSSHIKTDIDTYNIFNPVSDRLHTGLGIADSIWFYYAVHS